MVCLSVGACPPRQAKLLIPLYYIGDIGDIGERRMTGLVVRTPWRQLQNSRVETGWDLLSAHDKIFLIESELPTSRKVSQ
jgi:hypothetical protein